MVAIPHFLKNANDNVKAIYFGYQSEIAGKAEKLFATLFVFQWILGVVFAVVISPKTWSGEYSQVHIHVYAAVFLGGAIAAFPLFMIYAHPGKSITHHTIAFSQMLVSALLIHLSGGRIETHFHVFGSLAFLAFFREWRVIVTATIVVVADHLLRGFFWPESVYGVLSTTPWRSVEHAAWVIFEDVVLLYSIRIALRETARVAEKEDLLSETIGHINQAVAARTRELEETQEKAEFTSIQFKAIFDNAAVGVVAIDENQKMALTNGAFQRMMGYSNEELSHKAIYDIIHPDEVVESRSRLSTAVKEDTTYNRDKRHIKKDGSILWARVTVTLMKDNIRGVKGVGIIEDVTAQRHAEEKIKQQEVQIRDAAIENARQAGMSEIATGVLHNVGNVLNSANIGLEMIVKKLDNSVIENLHMANNLLSQHLDHLGEFFASDPKGKKLAHFYLELGDAVKKEAAGQRHEAGDLMKRLQLIKDVINTQQMYAKGRGEFKESVSLLEVTESALVIQSNGLSRHEIQVIKKFSDVPPVLAQKSKLVHVVLNLIKNAKEAMDTRDSKEKILTLEIGSTPGGQVFLKVSDTGMGIDEKNLSKIFNHGFTTKQAGHGFGLHFCANSATEMGAKMSVTSEGVGRGASFIIHFNEDSSSRRSA